MTGSAPTLAEFLRARLDEDEQVARAASPGPWHVDDEIYAQRIVAADDTAVVDGGRWGGEASVFDFTEDALHIARHDPARVLAQVEMMRHIVDMHEPCGQCGPFEHEPECHRCAVRAPCMTLRLVAEVWAEHPDHPGR